MTQCEDEGNVTELSTVLSKIRILCLLLKMSVGGGKVDWAVKRSGVSKK